jgi:hypothetical protein
MPRLSCNSIIASIVCARREWRAGTIYGARVEIFGLIALYMLAYSLALWLSDFRGPTQIWNVLALGSAVALQMGRCFHWLDVWATIGATKSIGGTRHLVDPVSARRSSAVALILVTALPVFVAYTRLTDPFWPALWCALEGVLVYSLCRWGHLLLHDLKLAWITAGEALSSRRLDAELDGPSPALLPRCRTRTAIIVARPLVFFLVLLEAGWLLRHRARK